MKLKVYGWYAIVPGARQDGLVSRQSRCIMAARSLKEVARIMGYKGPWALPQLCETGNRWELLTAVQRPGMLFYLDPGNPNSSGPWRVVDPENLY